MYTCTAYCESGFPTTVYHVVFDELLKETGLGSHIIV